MAGMWRLCCPLTSPQYGHDVTRPGCWFWKGEWGALMAAVPQWFPGPRRAWPWSCPHTAPMCPGVASFDGGLAPTGGFAAWGVPWKEVRAGCTQNPWVLHQGRPSGVAALGCSHRPSTHLCVDDFGALMLCRPPLGKQHTWESGTLS